MIRIGFILVLAVITGCATAPVVQNPAELAATHGYVYVNFPSVGAGDALTLEAVDAGGKAQELRSRQDAEIAASGWWLPAGEYRLTKWLGYKLGEGYPPIVVEAGRVTDLGTLVYIPVGGYEFVILPLRHDDTRSHIEAPLKEYANLLTSNEPIRWEVAETPEAVSQDQGVSMSGLGLVADLLLAYDRRVNKPSMKEALKKEKNIATFFALAADAAAPYGRLPVADRAGNHYYGAGFGRIRVRSGDGNWSAIDTGSLHAVTELEAAGGELVAGYRNGELKRSNASKTAWQTLRKFPANEVIADISFIGGKLFVTTMQMGADRSGVKGFIQVYAADSDDFSQLQPLRRFVIEKADFNYAASVTADSERLYVAAFPDSHQLTVADMSWKVVSPPGRVHSFNVYPGSEVLAAYRTQGILSEVYVSADRGNTWQEYNDPPLGFFDTYFSDVSTGYALRWDMNAFSAELELLEYDKASDKWNLIIEAPLECRGIARDPAMYPRYCVTHGGSILRHDPSAEGGWVVEFSAE